MTTLKDLAKLLNVSISTVSKALNDSDDIGEKTKIRVKEAAELYNYTPNQMALGLKNNQTKTIGVIIPNILNHFFAKVIFGIEKAARQHSYDTIICISHEKYASEVNSLEVLTNGRVDGFIMSLASETLAKEHVNHIKTFKKADQALVLFDRVSEKITCDKIIIDDEQSLYKATQHLIKNGRQNIAFVSQITNLEIGKLPLSGYRKALKKADLPFDEQKVLKLSTSENAHQLMKGFLLSQDIDAIVSADNTSGIMLINTAKDLGFEVPKDIAVIGFGDEETSYLTYPQMSYINQNPEEIGKTATELLIQRIENETNDQHNFKTIKLSTSLALRATS
ncbi:MAG: LacI family transcriptional regulator [Psychroflexus sp.]|nr:LacI family transcriptional regulator [Psychroflexus sp.]MDN6311233.1 LacI family transcriptional regulator [Psychroflexus sp.]